MNSFVALLEKRIFTACNFQHSIYTRAMAKQQSFGEKATKKKADLKFKSVKMVVSTRSPKTGHWRFNEKFVKIPIEMDDIKFLEQEIKKA
jgi:hypothetical protein